MLLVAMATGAGLSAATLLAAGELRFHLAGPCDAALISLALLALGGLGGLAAARRFAARQAAGRADALPPPTPDAAASAVALVLLMLAGSCAVLTLGSSRFEDCRLWLAGAFLWPPTVLQAAALSVAAAALLVTGAVAGAALLALHGWWRLSTVTTGPRGTLAAALACGAALGSVLTQPQHLAAVRLAAPLLICLAALLAVARNGPTPLAPQNHQRFTRLSAAGMLLRLAPIASASAAVTLALAIANAGQCVPWRPAHWSALAAGGWTAGCVLLAWFAEPVTRLPWGPFCALLTAALLIALAVGDRHAATDAGLLVVLAAAAAMSMHAAATGLVGPRQPTRHRAWVLAAALGGVVAGGLPVVAGGSVSAVAIVLAALTSLLAAGVLVASAVPGSLRNALFVAACGLGLVAPTVLLPTVDDPPRRRSHRSVSPPQKSCELIELLQARGLRCLQTAWPQPFVWAGADGAGYDLILLTDGESTGSDPSARREWDRRVLARFGQRLRRGGRLVLAGPLPPGRLAVLRQYVARRSSDNWSLFRIEHAGRREFFMAGADVLPLAEHTLPDDAWRVAKLRRD